MVFECFRCGFTVPAKSKLIDHLSRKRICEPIKQDISVESVYKHYQDLWKEKKVYHCEFCHLTSETNDAIFRNHKLRCKKKNAKFIQKKEEYELPIEEKYLRACQEIKKLTEKNIQKEKKELERQVEILREELEKKSQEYQILEKNFELACHTIEFMKKNVVPKKKEPRKKEVIPMNIRRAVWSQHIGLERGSARCYCCNITEIYQMTFHCGHVVSEVQGGKVTIDNLRPICQTCNSSMGTKNMHEYMIEYGFTN
jgi:hypothetical protein